MLLLRFFPLSVGSGLFCLSVAGGCVTGSSEKWSYTGGDIGKDKRSSLFKQQKRVCESKYRLAVEAKKEFNLKSNPRAAFDYCMQQHGWQKLSDAN